MARFLRSGRVFWLAFIGFAIYQVPWGLFLTYLMVGGSTMSALDVRRSVMSAFLLGAPRLILTTLFVSSLLAWLRGRRTPAVVCLLGACVLELAFAGFFMSGPVPPSVFFQFFVAFTIALPLLLCVWMLVDRLRKGASHSGRVVGSH